MCQALFYCLTEHLARQCLFYHSPYVEFMFTDQQLELIASELRTSGFCILRDALPQGLSKALSDLAISRTDYRLAGTGRKTELSLDTKVRSDQIVWIEGGEGAEREWIAMMEGLQQYLNRALYLGLFSFESHFAHYAPGAHYEKHRDAFKGQSNRILSCVTYLNDEWHGAWGGELVIYSDEDRELIRVLPERGSVVLFLSEEFPHEVLPASAHRHSIAGWFRVNGSEHGGADPSR